MPATPPDTNILTYSTVNEQAIDKAKKSLRRILLWTGILATIIGVLMFVQSIIYFAFNFSTNALSLSANWTNGVLLFAGIFSLWLRRRILAERRKSILVGAVVVLGYAVGIAAFLVVGFIEMTEEDKSIPIAFIGVLGFIFLLMELGLIVVSTSLFRLWSRLSPKVTC